MFLATDFAGGAREVSHKSGQLLVACLGRLALVLAIASAVDFEEIDEMAMIHEVKAGGGPMQKFGVEMAETEVYLIDALDS